MCGTCGTKVGLSPMVSPITCAAQSWASFRSTELWRWHTVSRHLVLPQDGCRRWWDTRLVSVPLDVLIHDWWWHQNRHYDGHRSLEGKRSMRTRWMVRLRHGDSVLVTNAKGAYHCLTATMCKAIKHEVEGRTYWRRSTDISKGTFVASYQH